jgi:hypothetical protein
MVEQDLQAAESVNVSVELALNAQLAFIGQLISTLIASSVISAEQAVEMLTKLADTITSSLNRPGSDLQAIRTKPIREHAERELAADLLR